MAEPIIQNIVFVLKDDDLETASAELKKLAREAQKTEKKGNRLQQFAQKVGTRFKQFIGGVAVTAVLAVGAALFKAGKLAVSFQSQMSGVRKTTGLAGAKLEELGLRLLRMSARLAVSQDQLTAIAETAGQLGIRGVDGIALFTEVVAKLVRVSDLTADGAAASLARISNAFDLPIEQAENLASVVNELSNTTTAKAGDITTALEKVGGGGKAIGLTVDQVAALSAVLIDTGVVAPRAGTNLRNIFVLLQTESEKLGQVVGMTGEEFIQAFQKAPLETLRQYLDAIKAMPAELQAVHIDDVFGKENFAAVQALANQTDLLSKNLKTSQTAFAEGTSLNREYAAGMDNVSAQWDLFLSKLSAFGTRLASRTLPLARKLLDFANNLAASSEEVAGRFQKAAAAARDLDALEEAVTTFETLSHKQHLTTNETQALEQATDLLQTRFGEFVRETNAAGKAVSFYTDQLRDAIDAERNLNRKEQRKALLELVDDYETLSRRQAVLRDQMELLNRAIPRLQANYDSLNKGGLRRVSASVVDAANALNTATDRFKNHGREADETRIKLDDTAESIKRLFQEQERFSMDAMIKALVLAGVAIDDARSIANDFLGTLKELGKVPLYGPRAGQDAPLPPFSAAFQPTFTSQTPTTPEITPTLTAEIEALEKRKEKLLETRAATDELAEVNRQLNALIKERDRLSSFGVPDPDAAKRQRQELEQAKDALEALAEKAVLATAASERHRGALDEMIEAEKDLNELKKLQNKLGEEATITIAGQEVALSSLITKTQERLDKAEEEVRQAEDLARSYGRLAGTLQKALPRPLDLTGGPDGAALLLEVEGRLATFNDAITTLRNNLASGAIDEESFLAEVDREAQALLEHLIRIASQAGEISGPLGAMIQAALEKAFAAGKSATDEADKSAKKYAETLSDISGALDGLRGLLDVFGALDERLDSLLSGTADVLDSLQRLRQFRDTFDKPGGPESGSAAAIFGQITPLLGIATGIAGFVSSLIGDSGKTREELRQLQEALRKNARDIARAVRDFTQSARVGFDRPAAEVADIRAARAQYDADQAARPEPGSEEDYLYEGPGTNQLFHKLLDALEAAGLDVDQFREQFSQLTQSGLSADDAAARVLESLDPVIDSLGTFGKSVDGAAARMDLVQRLLGSDFPAAFKGFLDFLLDPENEIDLSPRAKALLKEAQELDLSKEEDRERAKAIGQAFAQAILDNDTAFLDGLSPEDAEKIAEIFLEAGGEAFGDGSDTETNALQVQRVITDVQGNAVVRGLEVIAHWTRRTAEILDARLVKGLPGSPSFDKGFGGAGPSAIALPQLPPLPPIFYETRPPISETALRALQSSSTAKTFNIPINVDTGGIDVDHPDFPRIVSRAVEEDLRRWQASPFRSY